MEINEKGLSPPSHLSVSLQQCPAKITRWQPAQTTWLTQHRSCIYSFCSEEEPTPPAEPVRLHNHYSGTASQGIPKPVPHYVTTWATAVRVLVPSMLHFHLGKTTSVTSTTHHKPTEAGPTIPSQPEPSEFAAKDRAETSAQVSAVTGSYPDHLKHERHCWWQARSPAPGTLPAMAA
ncbi:hypothetical protein DPEC_G00134420 [Dallia pectoralis]|uniref:Uncharacterized protein n=1 Tax=Dallia pectoralis TaxID=75939 RepID=A0ACC2GS26_DALPE|nr:hypothetical protein DPEC_G00134420 [Dallia pectoralis]